MGLLVYIQDSAINDNVNRFTFSTKNPPPNTERCHRFTSIQGGQISQKGPKKFILRIDYDLQNQTAAIPSQYSNTRLFLNTATWNSK